MPDATQTIVNQLGYNPEVAPYLRENIAQARALTYNYKQTPALDAAGRPIIGADGRPVLTNLLGADKLPVIESFKDPEQYGGQVAVQVPVLDAAGKPVIGADGYPVTRDKIGADGYPVTEFKAYERLAGLADLQKSAMQGARDMAAPKYDAAGKYIPTANENAQSIMKKAAEDARDASYTKNTYSNAYTAPTALGYTADTYGGASAGIPFPAAYMGTTAGSYGGASAAAPTDATSKGYTADTYGGASAGSATDATSEGYTATAADRLGATAATLGGAPTAVGQTTGYNPTLTNYQMGGPERVNTRSFIDKGTADSYMSPYMQNVVDIQQREAQRQADIAATQQQSAATKAGGFGGGRDAIMRAEAARNLATQKGDIQAQGLQAAYQQAQQQFNAEQGYGLQGQIANQQAGLTQGQQNLGANLGVQQLGVQTGLQTSLANLNNQQQAELANQALKGQYGLTQGQMSQQANMQTSSQAQQAALQDAAAKNQASQFTKTAANQAQLANAQEANRMAQYNASNIQQAGLQGSAAKNQALQFGSAASNQAQLANRAAENQMAQYNASNLQQAGMQNAALTSQANQFGSAAYNQAALVNAQRADQMAQYNASNLQQAGLASAAAKNQAAQFGAEQKLTSAGLGAQYGQAANQLTEQSGQFGANFGLQGDQAAMQGATGLSNVAGQGYNQNFQTNQLLAGYGNQQQQQEQQRLSTLYQDFLNQQNDPYKKIGFMANTASAAPTANLGSTMYQAAPSTLNTLVGGATVLGAAALKSASGGMVGRYAKGGLVRSRPQGLVALAIHSMA